MRRQATELILQQLSLLGDVIALEIMSRRGWSEDDIRHCHANLE
ncbi:MAG: hypothetical protein VB071_03405 [Lawsonibacter sp.]|nr:hypothetical protein [Lawsonibacter sp.]